MTAITEDYVSFETAKLLKEKGFDVPCGSYYDYFRSNVTMYQGYVAEFSGSCTNHNGRGNHDVFSRPTQQIAMRWLREVHKCFIQIRFANGCTSFTFFVYKNGTDCYPCNIYYDSYEEAVENSIKYCLENLI